MERKGRFRVLYRDLTPLAVTIAVLILLAGFMTTLAVVQRSSNREIENQQNALSVESRQQVVAVSDRLEGEIREFTIALLHTEATHPAPAQDFRSFFESFDPGIEGGDSLYGLLETLERRELDRILERETALNPQLDVQTYKNSDGQRFALTRSVDSEERSMGPVVDDLVNALPIEETESVQIVQLDPKSFKGTGLPTTSVPIALVGPIRDERGAVDGYLVRVTTLLPVLGSSVSNVDRRTNIQIELNDSLDEVFVSLVEPNARLEDARYRERFEIAAGSAMWTVTTWGGVTSPGIASLFSPSFEWFFGLVGTANLAIVWLLATSRGQRSSDASKQIEQAWVLAKTDRLTGLLNRTGLTEACVNLGSVRATLFFIDLNHFKVVNDRYGHKAGDQVLIAVAGALQETTRPIDKIARIGGDEFVVLMPGMVDRRRAGRLSRAIERKIGVMGTGVTASVGIASSGDEQPLLLEELLQEADAEMYARKRAFHEGIPNRRRVST